MNADDRARSILAECTTLTLSTIGPDGLWSADLFFAAHGVSRLYFVSNPSTRHGSNILERAQVAGTLHPDVGYDWQAIRGLQFVGLAGLVLDEELADAQTVYFERFPFVARLMQPDAEVRAKTAGTRFFVVRLSSLYVIDNRLGFGNRQEVSLKDG